MLLEIKDLCAGYGDLQVLFNISMNVDEGEVVSLVGSNGAGKTTLLRILSGLEPVKSGTITYRGEDLTRIKAYEKADHRIAHIPQGRGILGSLSSEKILLWVHIQRRHVQHWKKIYRNLLRCSLYSRNVRIRWQDH